MGRDRKDAKSVPPAETPNGESQSGGHVGTSIRYQRVSRLSLQTTEHGASGDG